MLALKGLHQPIVQVPSHMLLAIKDTAGGPQGPQMPYAMVAIAYLSILEHILERQLRCLSRHVQCSGE